MPFTGSAGTTKKPASALPIYLRKNEVIKQIFNQSYDKAVHLKNVPVLELTKTVQNAVKLMAVTRITHCAGDSRPDKCPSFLPISFRS